MPNRTVSPFSAGPWVLIGLIIAVALTRLIPHPPNFSPVEAMALFGGAYFAKRSWAVIVPLVALFISDLGLGLMMGGDYFQYFVSAGFLLVYFTIAALTVLGFGLRNKVSVLRVAGYGIAGSVIFFLVTNFGVWFGSSFYPQTANGLISAYIAGLPFLQNGVLGTLFYSAILFGGYALLKQRLPALANTHG
jgi:hypothetical protein